MKQDSEITNSVPLEQNNSSDVNLEDSIIGILLKGDHVVIPAFGYLEIKSIAGKRTVLYKTAGSDHPNMKSFTSGDVAIITSTLYNTISAPLKEGKKIFMPKIGTFHPIKTQEGSFRLSFTASANLRNILNGETEKKIEKIADIKIIEDSAAKLPENINENFNKEDENIPKKELSEEKENLKVKEDKKTEEKLVQKVKVEHKEDPLSDILQEKSIAKEIYAAKDRSSKPIRSNKPEVQKKPVTNKVPRPKDPVISQHNLHNQKKKSSKRYIGIFIAVVILLLCMAGILFFPHEEGGEQTSNIKDNIETVNLLSLAEKHYGNQIFWVYIYDANREKIKSPVNIPQNVILTIPDLSEYDINTKDSIEIYLAKIKAELILERNRAINN